METSMSARLATRALVTAAAMGVSLLAFAHPAVASGSDEFYFVNAINAVRANRGLAPLVVDGQLTSTAQSWSSHMAGDGTLSHNPNLSSQVSNWRTLGENVGTGSSLQSIEAAFENSPHHFENMVDPGYQYVGVGVVQDGNGTYWVTEDFKQAATAPKPAPRPAAPAPPKAVTRPPAAKPAPRFVTAPRAAAPAHAAATAAPMPAPAPAPTAVPTPTTVPLAVLGTNTHRVPAATGSTIANPFTPDRLAALVALVLLGSTMALFFRVRQRIAVTGVAG